MLLPFITTTAHSLPSGDSAMPSGVWPTTTVSTTRNGCACRSMTLTVSLSPLPRPMFATTAIEPSALTSSPYGRIPALRSRLLCSTLVPSTVSTEMKLSPSRDTSAARPSRVKAGWLGPDLSSPSRTTLEGATVLPWMVNTDTVPSARLATSASVPCRLIDTPAAPIPASSVAITAGGVARRSTTLTRLSGTVLVASAGSFLVDEVTRARPWSGVIATLIGGPTTLPGTGISAMHLRWRHAEIDDGHGVGRRVGDDLDHPVVENDLVVVRRDRPLGRRAGRQREPDQPDEGAAGARSGAHGVVSWVPPLGVGAGRS